MAERRGILYGLPVRICADGSCEPIGPFSGFFLDLFTDVAGFNGSVMEYTGRSYWAALWFWLTHWEVDGG